MTCPRGLQKVVNSHERLEKASTFYGLVKVRSNSHSLPKKGLPSHDPGQEGFHTVMAQLETQSNFKSKGFILVMSQL